MRLACIGGKGLFLWCNLQICWTLFLLEDILGDLSNLRPHLPAIPFLMTWELILGDHFALMLFRSNFCGNTICRGRWYQVNWEQAKHCFWILPYCCKRYVKNCAAEMRPAEFSESNWQARYRHSDALFICAMILESLLMSYTMSARSYNLWCVWLINIRSNLHGRDHISKLNHSVAPTSRQFLPVLTTSWSNDFQMMWSD